jgi:hypothetical protein
VIKDYGAICLAAAMAGAVYMFIIEWLNNKLYQEHLTTTINATTVLSIHSNLNEVRRLWDLVGYPWEDEALQAELTFEPRGPEAPKKGLT